MDILILALNVRWSILLPPAIFPTKQNSNQVSEPKRLTFQVQGCMHIRIFDLQHQCLPRCSILFSATHGNHISFNQDSSQVDSLDLVDFDRNKDIWVLGVTPINVPTLKKLLDIYPNKSDVAFLAEGFEFGFELHYKGPFYSGECKNLKSVLQNEVLANEKLDQEVALCQIAGPFPFKPISNLRCSSIGLVLKKTCGFWLITHLFYPAGLSVNDGIDDALASVTYFNFDNAVGSIKMLGKGALLGKFDVKSVFRLLPLEIRAFLLLGIKLGHNYYIDKMTQMGLKSSCAAWEAFAKFLN